MLELINESPWTTNLYPGFNQQGYAQIICVIKTSYAFDMQGQLNLQIPSDPIIESDQYYGNPTNSSLLASLETMPFKQGSEILVHGTAYPPTSNSQVCSVALQVQSNVGDKLINKTLRIFGERVWKHSLVRIHMSLPQVLKPVPLRYENSFGGQDPYSKKNNFIANPVGKGFTETPWQAKDLLLPLIEQERQLIKRITHHPQPAGFGPIPAHWQPRLNSIRLQNAIGKDSPFIEPLVPDFYNVAPRDQQMAQALQGDEIVQLQGLWAANPLALVRLQLPGWKGQLYLYQQGAWYELTPTYDTVIIDTERKVLNCIWRVGIPWDLDGKQKGIIRLLIKP